MKENTFAHSFQNRYSKHINYIPFLGFSLLRDQDVPIRKGIWRRWRRGGGGDLPASQKVWTFPFCLISPPPKNWVPLYPDHRPHIGKKVSLIAFRQILSKLLPEACIFSNTIMTYLKKFVGTKSLNTKHYPTGLSSRIIYTPLSP